jgi:hypothetical protein
MYSYYLFLTSALSGREWSVSQPDRAVPLARVRSPGTHWIGGWMGLKSWSGHKGRRKNSFPLPVIEPCHTVCGQTLYLLSYARSYPLSREFNNVGRVVSPFGVA